MIWPRHLYFYLCVYISFCVAARSGPGVTSSGAIRTQAFGQQPAVGDAAGRAGQPCQFDYSVRLLTCGAFISLPAAPCVLRGFLPRRSTIVVAAPCDCEATYRSYLPKLPRIMCGIPTSRRPV